MGEQEYISILNTTLKGYIAELCIDVPFCWKFMYDTHRDLTWATANQVPDIVNITMEIAKNGPPSRRLQSSATAGGEAAAPVPSRSSESETHPIDRVRSAGVRL